MQNAALNEASRAGQARRADSGWTETETEELDPLSRRDRAAAARSRARQRARCRRRSHPCRSTWRSPRATRSRPPRETRSPCLGIRACGGHLRMNVDCRGTI
eukprot:6205315-Pleurochrysis_carterae.AAC.2